MKVKVNPYPLLMKHKGEVIRLHDAQQVCVSLVLGMNQQEDTPDQAVRETRALIAELEQWLEERGAFIQRIGPTSVSTHR